MKTFNKILLMQLILISIVLAPSIYARGYVYITANNSNNYTNYTTFHRFYNTSNLLSVVTVPLFSTPNTNSTNAANAANANASIIITKSGTIINTLIGSVLNGGILLKSST